jgi:hypothetical protein
MQSPVPNASAETPSRRERDFKNILIACSILAACAAFPGRAQTRKALPVGKVDTAKFQSVYAAGVRLEPAWKAGSSPLELRALARDLQAEVAIVRESEKTEAERLFVRAMNHGATAYVASAAIWEADNDETRRGAAIEAATLFSLEGNLWTTKDKVDMLLDEGSAYVRAAAHYYSGRIGEGLAVEQEISERVSARRAAKTDREMSSQEFESVRTRLYSRDVEDRRLAAIETLEFGPAAARFEQRLRQLAADPDLLTRTAAMDALAAIDRSK